MKAEEQIDDNNRDKHVDDEIAACLNIENPKSFFLFAGAGSGKTGSLVNVLKKICNENNRDFEVLGKRVAVITYTNAACDEIKHRLDYNPLVEVSTIHSFVWSLIEGYNKDIRQWLKGKLVEDIAKLEADEAKGRAGTKASIDRIKSIEEKNARLLSLDTVKIFTYSPVGNNRGRAALNHSDVIKMSAEFLSTKPLMQSLLINRFPMLLIDESQDTNRVLMDAFLTVQSKHSSCFALGLLGDTMQRIYADGKVDIDKNLPEGWSTPKKVMNHRCPERVVKLINKIRSEADGQEQQFRQDKLGGFVRLFIADSGTNRAAIEKLATEKMSVIASDDLWRDLRAEVKSLILEHHMAAERMGFLELYETLHKAEALRTGLNDGTLSGLKLFSEIIYPIVQAKQKSDEFKIASIVRNHSPLLSKKSLFEAGEKQSERIKAAKKGIDSLLSLWSGGNTPKFIDVLLKVSETKLFEIPDSLRTIVARSKSEQEIAEQETIELLKKESSNVDEETEEGGEEENASVIDAWDAFLQVPFSQIEPYISYVTRLASFDTHQGVKGLQFPRVMVIIDDTASRGFLFSYDKLFGVKDKTSTDLQNERDKKETSEDRTRRLLYVTCSRAEKSLAIIAYTNQPEVLRTNVVQRDWFSDNEVEILQQQ